MRAAPFTSVRSAPLEASFYPGAQWGCCLHERRPSFLRPSFVGQLPAVLSQPRAALSARGRVLFAALRPRLSAALRLTPRPLGRRFVPGAMTRVVFLTFQRVGNFQSRAVPEGTRTTVCVGRQACEGCVAYAHFTTFAHGARWSASLRWAADGARRLRSRRPSNKAKRPPEDNEA